jgi:hypothetical protein
MNVSDKSTIEIALFFGTIAALILVGISGYDAAHNVASVSTAINEQNNSPMSSGDGAVDDVSMSVPPTLQDYLSTLTPEDKAEFVRAGAITLGSLIVR